MSPLWRSIVYSLNDTSEPEQPIRNQQTRVCPSSALLSLSPNPISASEPGPSGVEHDPQPPPSQSLDKINDYVNDLVRPLQEQIQSFKLELERLNTQVAELLEAKAALTNQIESLRGQTHSSEDEISKLKERFTANRARDESLYG